MKMNSLSTNIQQGSQMSISWIKNSFNILKNQGYSQLNTARQRRSEENGAELEVQMKDEKSVFSKFPKY